MQKIIKVFICLFIFFSCPIFWSFSSAKYVIDDVIKVATLNIDRSKPKIEFFDFSTSIIDNPNNDNKLYNITGYFRITEKNIAKENLFANSLKFFVNDSLVSPDLQKFYITFKNSYEMIYQLSFFISFTDGLLTIEIPEGVITDKSGLTNDKTTFSINPAN